MGSGQNLGFFTQKLKDLPNKMAPLLKGCRAQGQLNASIIVNTFNIYTLTLCDDFRSVHSKPTLLYQKM